VDGESEADEASEARRRIALARVGVGAAGVLVTAGLLLVVSGYIGTPRSDAAIVAGVVVVLSGALVLLTAGWTLRGGNRQAMG